MSAAEEARKSEDAELALTLDIVEVRLLGHERTMRRRDVSAGAAVSLHSARKFWRALGFPAVGEEDLRFTRSDLFALQEVVDLVRRGVFDESTALAMTRAVARSTDRLAVWQTQLMAESLAEALAAKRDDEADGRPEDGGGAAPEREVALAAAVRLAELADDLEPLLVYAWRRHLVGAISRMVTESTVEPDADLSHSVSYTVGFADLVSFTRLVRRSTERQLAKIVQRFEALATDIITAHGGRVIKTVGDEVMWVCAEPTAAADVALDLVDAMAGDDLLPPLRVGLATGHVVPRLGDVFGTTVNRASRLTALARPNAILIDGPTAAALPVAGGFTTAAGRPRALRGIGPVVPWMLHRSSADGARRDGHGRRGLRRAGA